VVDVRHLAVVQQDVAGREVLVEAGRGLLVRAPRAAQPERRSRRWSGTALWSLGGLFLVNSPEQRFGGIRGSVELAWDDWQGSAQFDRVDDEDRWAVQWARAYVDFAAGELAGFGGGGVHGYNSLEGSFLGGSLGPGGRDEPWPVRCDTGEGKKPLASRNRPAIGRLPDRVQNLVA
jgi:predicted oxidoreductase